MLNYERFSSWLTPGQKRGLKKLAKEKSKVKQTSSSDLVRAAIEKVYKLK